MSLHSHLCVQKYYKLYTNKLQTLQSYLLKIVFLKNVLFSIIPESIIKFVHEVDMFTYVFCVTISLLLQECMLLPMNYFFHFSIMQQQTLGEKFDHKTSTQQCSTLSNFSCAQVVGKVKIMPLPPPYYKCCYIN